MESISVSNLHGVVAAKLTSEQQVAGCQDFHRYNKVGLEAETPQFLCPLKRLRWRLHFSLSSI